LSLPRPEPGEGAPNEKVTDWLIKINALIEKLMADQLEIEGENGADRLGLLGHDFELFIDAANDAQ
jgi:hypothetical protein